MVRKLELTGILAAMLTPMTENGAVSADGVERLADRLIVAGVNGLLPCGSTGEFASLDDDERRLVTEVTIKASRDRVPVIPGTGALTTKQTVSLSRHAQDSGASAVMIVPPFYEPPGFDELYRHFEAVAESIELPIVLYNIPSASGMNLSAAEIAKLAEIDNVQFVKDSSGDAAMLTTLVERYSDQIRTLNGWDTLTFYGFALGTRASVWGAANIFPRACVRLCESLSGQGDLPEARRIWAAMWPFLDFLESEGYGRSVKAATKLMGFDAGPTRAPYTALSSEQAERLASLLAPIREFEA